MTCRGSVPSSAPRGGRADCDPRCLVGTISITSWPRWVWQARSRSPSSGSSRGCPRFPASPQPFKVVVDYAPTPDALEWVLRSLRELSAGRLIVLFGCGGDRDRKKRPLMGEAAVRWADRVILTSDNPRSESPETILEEIEAGIRSVSGGAERTVRRVDRRGRRGGGGGGGGAPGREMASFSTDSRTLKPGDFFVALKGKSFDGHTFLSEAAGKGALGCVVAAPPSIPLPPGFVVIQVEETKGALGQIAECRGRRYPARVVAVAGRNGKTTSKEMTGSVLRHNP